MENTWAKVLDRDSAPSCFQETLVNFIKKKRIPVRRTSVLYVKPFLACLNTSINSSFRFLQKQMYAV